MTQVPLANGGKGVLLVGGYKQLLLSGWGVGFSNDIFLLRDQGKVKLEWELLRSKLNVARYESVALAVKKHAGYKCS